MVDHVFENNLISYDHLIANNNGLWFMLLNLMEYDNNEGRIIQLILHTLSDHTEMMIVQNTNATKEYAYEIMMKQVI
jgi:hypothetical protein